MDIMKKSGVNYDYILALKKDGKGVKVVKYPIDRHDNQIDRAIERYYDESCDAVDVYSVVSSCLHNHAYQYCLAHEYIDKYIHDILPVDFDSYTYRKVIGDKIREEVDNRLKWLQKKSKVDYRKKIEIEEAVRKIQYPTIKKHKEKLLRNILPFIYASDYHNALQKIKADKECIVYSSEKHGDGRDGNLVGYHVEHYVNEDIAIKIKTNFCYGSSSYFNVVITYKDIELLPYSVWVKYYYAGYAQLLRYTRSYERRRESWHHCMNFLENFINSAIDNPELFIRNEVLTEIHMLMDGLDRIMTMDDTSFKQELEVRNNNTDIEDTRYIGIIGAYDATESDRNLYSIAPKEVAMIYRMEKISGALRFLENLRKMESLCSEVSLAIDRIIEMNKTLLPEVESAIPPVEEEIKALNQCLAPLEKDLRSNERSYNYHKAKIDKIYHQESSGRNRREVEEAYEIKKPIYKNLKEYIKALNTKIGNLKYKLDKRQTLLKRLDLYRSLILTIVR